MTVPSESSKTSYNSNGVTTAFATVFVFLENAHVKVWHTPTVGVRTLKTEGVHYSLSHPTPSGNGTVTFNVAPSTGLVEIERTLPMTQGINLRTQGPYSPAVLEEMADRLTQISQQLARRVTSLEAGGGAGGDAWVARADELQGEIDALTAQVGANTGSIDALAANLDALADAVNALDVPVAYDLPPEPVDATTGDPGDSAAFARGNHSHGHGNQPGGALHGLATTAADGFMSKELVQQLNGLSAENWQQVEAHTANNTPTQILTWTPADNSFEYAEVKILAQKDALNDAFAWSATLTTTRVAGTTSSSGYSNTAGNGWAVAIDVSSPLVRVRVTGGAYGVKWKVLVKRLTVTP